jgi:UTP-glucose-1-phosphate uridylyltransferase
MRQHITYVYQKERLGFGHAVWLTKKFADNEPVLLLLGDFVYRSNIETSCSKQIMDAYKSMDRDRIKALNPLKCIECGLCTYVCTSKIRVTDFVRRAKILAKL